MALSKTLLFILTISNVCINVYGLRTCDDCIKYTECPEANAALKMYGHSTKLGNLFKKAKCVNRDRRNYSVCCSDFSSLNDPILSHENVGLLADTCPDLNNFRIHGGTVAGLYELPWMTLLSYNDTITGLKFDCGGSILNSRYILTAAHCVKNQNVVGVRVGEHDIRSELDCEGTPPHRVCEGHTQDLLIENVKIHEDYVDRKQVKNDIALLRLKGSISFSHKNVARVCLPLSKDLRQPLTDLQSGIVAGWGLTEVERPSKILLKVEIPLLTNDTCNERKKEELLGNKVGLEFCAGKQGKDSCRGDSGGPFLMEKTRNGVTSYYQYGIVSRGGRECGASVGIYTNVVEYLEWILNNIKP